MKKYTIAIFVATALSAFAGEYSVNVTIPVKTEVVTTVTNVTESLAASTFVLERFTANVETTNVSFVIYGSYRDASGKVLKRKAIPVTMEQAVQMMPTINDVMSSAQLAVQSNIETLLAE